MADASFETEAEFAQVQPGQGLSPDVTESVALTVMRGQPGEEEYLRNYVDYQMEVGVKPGQFESQYLNNLATDQLSRRASGVTPQQIDAIKKEAPVRRDPAPEPVAPTQPTLRSGVGVPRRPEKLEMEEAFAEATEQLGVGGLSEAAQEAERAAAKEKKLFEDLGQELKEFKIQPFRAYDNTMFAVVAAISAGLGAAAQSLTGVPNTAVKLINQAIDRDIQSQKDQYNALKDKTNVQNNVYGRAMNALGDAKKAEDVARRLAYQTATQRVDASEKRYSQNEQLRTTAQRYRDMFALESAKLGAMTGKGAGDRETHAVAAEQGLNEISALIEAFGAVQEKAGPATLALTDMAQSVVGPALFGITKQRDAEVFFRARNALKNTLPALTTSVLKAVGEKGNLSEDEQRRYQSILERALPQASLVDVFGAEERKRQFTDNVNLIRRVLGLPAGNRERAKQLLDQIKQFEG
tara:strand:- start:197 stop:1594 length:1398 start_codon:yes stop_codon:yes gene_type:complete